MSDFWLGVVSVPAAMIASGVAWVALRWLAALSGKAAGRLIRMTPKATEQQRAAFGATAYACQRSWFLALGDFGIAVFAGQRSDDRREAYYRLFPKRSLRRITKDESA